MSNVFATGEIDANTPPQKHLPRKLREGLWLAGLLVLCGVLYLSKSAATALIDPDESRYALIVQHMRATGNWIQPHYNAKPYYDKPAPFFWLAGAGQWLTGSVELGGRLISAGSALAAVVLCWALGRRLGGPLAGLLAGTILGTSCMFFVLARVYRMDMAFSACLWGALWWFWRYEPSSSPPVFRWKQWAGFYVFCGLAVAMKGPAGLALPAMVVGAYLLLAGRGRRLLEPFHPTAILVFLLTALPWYLAIILRNPQYAYQFFVVQNVLRYTGGAIDRDEFLGIAYLAILLVGIMPWSAYLAGTVIRTFPTSWKRRGEPPERLYLWLAVLLPLLFFMFSHSRLVQYILPIFPPLAVLMALPLAEWVRQPSRDGLYRLGAIVLLVCVLVVGGTVFGGEFYLFGPKRLDVWDAILGGLALAGGGAVIWRLRRGRKRAMLVATVLTTAGFQLFAAVHTLPHVHDARSLKALGLSIRDHVTPETQFFYLYRIHPSFVLYAGGTDGEELQIDGNENIERLSRDMASSRQTYCLVRHESTLLRLQAACQKQNAPLYVLGKEEENYVVGNRRPRVGKE